MTEASGQVTLETHHEELVHDAKLDYYGKKMATCSSDFTVKIFEIEGENHREIETLKGHEGPVWQVDWAHPKFGNILASCSYDNKVIIWKEQNGSWGKIKEHTLHTASGTYVINSVAWAPHEIGPILACASSDGKVSILTFKDDGTWDAHLYDAHHIGVNSVDWAPATIPGALVQTLGGAINVNITKKFVTAEWKEESTLEGHTDWVRDVAWAPNLGLPKSCLASASQDKTVLIWTQESPNSQWVKKLLHNEKFSDAALSVKWSLSGNVLAVATSDNKVTFWKENLKGEWEMLTEMTE
ncbi:7698_t:CDS:2 [Entrophospora sp. SA101]|nr:7698_t:CDS:2 [Entrophospora sp. SA101]